jgi:hypothetical protein
MHLASGALLVLLGPLKSAPAACRLTSSVFQVVLCLLHVILLLTQRWTYSTLAADGVCLVETQ